MPYIATGSSGGGDCWSRRQKNCPLASIPMAHALSAETAECVFFKIVGGGGGLVHNALFVVGIM